MGQQIFQVDAFTAERFKGNPAAVCILAKPADEAWMQDVALEMNLSETAFLYPTEDGFSLRWFTPLAEVDLCGHATLASAHILFETGVLAPHEQARFHTRSGLLTASLNGSQIELDFPATPPEPADPPPGLAEALDVVPIYSGKTRFDHFLELRSEEEVRGVAPDFGRLKSLTVRGVMITSRSSSEDHDFVSRFFAPAVGVDEDPVTGSAHCCLGPFWAERLGKSELSAYQASARGGQIQVRIAGDRVHLAGNAVTVLRAELI